MMLRSVMGFQYLFLGVFCLTASFAGVSGFTSRRRRTATTTTTTCYPRRDHIMPLSMPLSMSLSMSSMASSASLDKDAAALYNPSQRDAKYNGNMAQYLVDLHDSEATFDFCGGMLFQLVLSQALRKHLVRMSATTQAATATNTDTNGDGDGDGSSVMVADATKARMFQLDGYSQTAQVDDRTLFHGREIRQVSWAKGGRGFVLQLSLANDNDDPDPDPDPEGWTPQERARYDGWGHDSGREWRQGEQLAQEGFAAFSSTFGQKAFSLHHRFYLHMDPYNRLWLAAEDGCEGTPSPSGGMGTGGGNPIQNFFQGLMS